MDATNPTFTTGSQQEPFFRRAFNAVRRIVWPASASRTYKYGVFAAGLLVVSLLVAGIVAVVNLQHSPAPVPRQEDTAKNQPTAGNTTAAKPNTAAPTNNSAQKSADKPATTTPQAQPKPTSTGQGAAPANTGGGTTASGGATGGGTSGTGGNTGNNGGGSATCAAFPLFPDANCTGYSHTGVTLHACDTTLTGNGAVYDSCLFDGGIVVVGSNVTVKRSKITGIVSANWDASGSLRGLTLQDVEIDGSPHFDPDGQAAIGVDNYTCIRCNVHNTGRGANFRNNVTIQDSYFHDFVYVSGAHQSGIGSNGGSNNTILHNNVICNGVGGSGCSGALVMYGDFDPIDNILIQNNLFNTDGSYCTYGGSTGTSSGKAYPHGTNVRYIDNRFGKAYYTTCADNGPVAAWEYNAGNVWTGNMWQDGSGTITP